MEVAAVDVAELSKDSRLTKTFRVLKQSRYDRAVSGYMAR